MIMWLMNLGFAGGGIVVTAFRHYNVIANRIHRRGRR
jgi:hypothetical protein